MSGTDEAIEALSVAAYRVPTERPESDGTLAWSATTMVFVRVRGAGVEGVGYSYSDRAAAVLIEDRLRDLIVGASAIRIGELHRRLFHAVRNLGQSGIAAAAISAIDIALWDLKARLFGVPLAVLLGLVRDEVPVYGSGGFTSYDEEEVETQLGGWVEEGMRYVKMKVGRDPKRDVERVAAARRVIGDDTELLVDANGAFSRKQALEAAEAFIRFGVTWFEEPVSSDDLEGLRLLRDRAPAGMEVSAGEYCWRPDDFRRLLEAGAVDVLQADVTRCGGISGLLQAAALCEAFHTPLSTHTAPAAHLHVACAALPVRHLEYFHDHARIEQLLFDGARVPVEGMLKPDLFRPGLGLQLKSKDAERFAL